MYFDGGDAAEVLHTWRRWCAGLSESVNTSVALLHRRFPACRNLWPDG